MRLPMALPDEILFSRISRHLSITGYRVEQYLKIFIGSSRASIHPFLNAHLLTISKYCSESAIELRQTQTLIPLFSHYVSEHRKQINNLSLSADDLVRACQLICFREHEVLSLKFCPACAQEDMKSYGVSYWHRSHQIPGIEACYKHRVWLEHQELLQRPHISNQCLPPTTTSSKQSSSLAWQLAKYSKNVLDKLSNESYKGRNFIDELIGKGYITASGRLWRTRFSTEMFEFVSKLKYPEKSLLPSSIKDLKYWSLILKNKGNQHPFKHLLLGFWLEKTRDKHVNPTSSKDQICDDKESIEQRCCALLIKGSSMAEVSRITDKSRCYIKHLALRKNIPINLKPKILTEELKRKIIKMAYKGFHRFAIAKQFGVSSGTVEMMISTPSGLVEWRQRCKAESRCRRYKVQLIRFKKNNPDALRQQVKEKCGAAFFWLYLHEKEWLEIHLPEATKPIYKNRVDWHQRDVELADIITKLLEQHLEKVTITELDRLLGRHGWLIKKRDELPITMAVYAQHLKDH
jgi:hypothetical protein